MLLLNSPLVNNIHSAFPFEQTIRDIHTELANLNNEAAELAAKIQKNFEELV
jgi:type I restriction enzyme M protein